MVKEGPCGGISKSEVGSLLTVRGNGTSPLVVSHQLVRCAVGPAILGEYD